MPETLLIMNGGDNGTADGKPAIKQQHQQQANGNGIVNGSESESNQQQALRFVYDDVGHINYLLDKMNTLRKSKQFCDVILQVGSQQDVHEVYAHRAVLASASIYFLDIFTNDSNTTACGIPQVQLYKLLSGNYDPEAFELIIDYIYTSRIEVKKEKVRAVYALANRLKLQSVALACGQYLASTLTPDSCLGVRAIPGVLNDPILLNAVDNYIRANIDQVANCKSVEALPKIKVEVLQKNREERAAVNEKQLLSFVVEWIRKAYDCKPDMETLTEKVFMLFLGKSDKRLHDCNDIQNGDSNCTVMVQDYKRMSRKLSFGSKTNAPTNGNESSTTTMVATEVTTIGGVTNGLNGANGVQAGPPKPQRQLFQRSDSDSSLSSIADDDESDWKVLGTYQTLESKHTIMGLIMVAGRLCVLTVKLRINDPNRTESTETENGEQDELTVTKQDNIVTIAPMSSARCAVGTACLKGKLFVCGGYDRGECLSSAEIYDADKNEWTPVAPMKVARGRFDIAVIDDKVFAVGGSDGHTELSSAELYDPVENVWRPLQNCPVARSNAAVGGLNGHLYVVGGWNGERGLKRCDKYDPDTNEWSQVGSLATGRYQAGVIVLGDGIYAIGGCDSWTCLNTVERFDPESNTWKQITPLNTARRGCGVVVFKNKIYVIAGHDGSRSLNSTEIYDPETMLWTAGPSLNACRANVGTTVVGDRLYACGGFTGKTFLSSSEYLDGNTDEWTTYLTSKENGENGLNGSSSETSLSENENIHHSLSKCSLLSEEPLVEVEETHPENVNGSEVD